MKIAIIGQQDFGKAVLEAFLARGDTVAGVFVAPEKEGAKADPMKTAATSLARALRLTRTEHTHLKALARDGDRRA